MAKNEAKIRFTAETGDFNSAIKQANNTMSELRAEMKLNDTRMKETGVTVEGLEAKFGILQNQLKASEAKTEAINQKFNKAKEIFGENSEEASKLKIQLLNAQNAEEKLRQAVNNCSNQIDEQKRSSQNAENAIEGLTDKVSRQQKELDDLKREYVDTVGEFGDTSDEAKKLEKSISDLSRELNDNKEKMSDAAKKADDFDRSLDGANDSAGKAGGGFTVLKGTVADLASEAIQMAIGKISEFIGYLQDLPAETLELRQDLATLTTSYDEMGFSTETAKNQWKDLYAVFGEDDRAVEASNLIAKMCNNEQDLADWTTITTGVWATYQDALPVESLAEASMETAKTGKITGTLADALNWAGVSEEEFQKKLDACNSEQERQALITDTLNGLYSDAAEKYRETAAGQMEAKEAAAEHMQAEAALAETIEPVTTEFTKLKTQLLEGIQPALEKVTEVATKALEWMQEHPTACQAIAAAVGVLTIGLGGLAIAVGIYTAAQWAMNSAVLANPITWIVIAIIAAIAALVAIGVVLYKNWDKIKAKAKEVWDNVTAKFNAAKAKVVNIVETIKTGISTRFEKIKSGAIDKFNAIKNALINPIKTAKEKIEGIIDKIKGLFDFSWSIPKPKIPKFKVSGGKAPWGFGGKGKLPSVDVKWNALGAVLTKPTIVGSVGNTLMGAGEAGAEAILPISVLQDYINRAFDRNVLSYAAAGGGGEVYNFYVNDATINDNAQMRDVAKDFITEMVRLGGMNR